MMKTETTDMIKKNKKHVLKIDCFIKQKISENNRKSLITLKHVVQYNKKKTKHYYKKLRLFYTVKKNK